MIYDWTIFFLARIGFPTLAMACVGLSLGLFVFGEARPASKAILITVTAYAVNVVQSALGVTVANFGWVAKPDIFPLGRWSSAFSIIGIFGKTGSTTANLSPAPIKN